jgi:PleD family two-component response regulator
LVVPGATRQRPFPPLERLQGAVADIPIGHAGSSINVTASFGVAWLTDNSDTAEPRLSHADVALYSAKQAGRIRLENAATGQGSDKVRPPACSSTRLPG